MADISKIQTGANGTVYNIVDASAVHTVDSSLSSSSENPVQNKVIKGALDGKKDVVNLGSLTTSSLGGDQYSISGIASADVTKINAMSAPYDVAFSTTIDSTALDFCGTYNGDETINGGTYHMYTGTLKDGSNNTQTFNFGVLSTGTTGILSLVSTISGEGTSGYLAKFDGAHSITNGPQLGNSTNTYLRNDGTWASPTVVYRGWYDPTDAHGAPYDITLYDSKTADDIGNDLTVGRKYVVLQLLKSSDPTRTGIYQRFVFAGQDNGSDTYDDPSYTYYYFTCTDEDAQLTVATLYRWYGGGSYTSSLVVCDPIDLTPPQITIDSALSTTSTNPVQNRVITNALATKVDLTSDQTIGGVKTFSERPLVSTEVELPSGYTQLEYIHGDGTAYINTGRHYSTDDTILLTFKQATASNYRIWGTFNQSNYVGPNVSMTYSAGWMVRQETASGQQRGVGLTPIDTNRHTLQILSDGTVIFDDQRYTRSAGWASGYTFSYNAYLFTINPGNSTPTATMVGDIYRYRVWNNLGQLVQDMYPVSRTTGGTTTYGMYDIINNTFYGNANSSGTFTGGGTFSSSEILVEDDLAPVAFSGSYNDLTDRPVDELFKCTFNSTTYAQITAALSANRLPYLVYNNYFYYFNSNQSSNVRYVFTSVTNTPEVRSTWVSTDNVWQTPQVVTLADASDIPTDYIHDGNYTTAQYRKGGLVIGASNSSEAGGVNVTNGRIYVTGVSNPLFGLKSSDSDSTQFFLQVTKDHMYVGPTSSNALDFASTGITTLPNNLIVKGNIIKYGGTSSQFLKADGSVDSTVYSTFSGNYNDLTNKPTIPTQTSQLTNNGSDGTSTYVEADELATVATSGSYTDLINTPTIPTNTSDLVNDGANGTSAYVEANDLAAVATSGSYNDLSDKPTIPGPELYRCVFNTTTYAQITQAISDGKLPYVVYNDGYYLLTSANASNYHFAGVMENGYTNYVLYVSTQDIWTVEQDDLQPYGYQSIVFVDSTWDWQDVYVNMTQRGNLCLWGDMTNGVVLYIKYLDSNNAIHFVGEDSTHWYDKTLAYDGTWSNTRSIPKEDYIVFTGTTGSGSSFPKTVTLSGNKTAADVRQAIEDKLNVYLILSISGDEVEFTYTGSQHSFDNPPHGTYQFLSTMRPTYMRDDYVAELLFTEDELTGTTTYDFTVELANVESTSNKVTSISASSTNTQYPSALAVYNAISGLPTPMQFKGTVGSGGTIEWANLPTASTSNGYTYKVITDHSTAPICKVGDTIISNGSTWVVVPSGDEPVGVQSIGFTQGDGIVLTVTPDNPITSSGTVTVEHEDTSSQASVSNSGRTYIQSVTLDTFGHVTGLSSATETVTDDHKVTQVAVPSGTPEPTASPHNVLIGYSEGGSAETNYVRKSAITYNQTTKALSTGGAINGYTLNAASEKAVDTSISAASTSTNLPTSQAVASFVEGKGYVDTDTTYAFADGTNGFTVTESINGVAQPAQFVNVTPSIANNITGSGTSTHLAKFTAANTIGDAEPTIDTNGLHTSKAIFLQNIDSSVTTTVSRLYFGSSPSSYYSYLSSNTSGAFTLASPNGNFTLYANTAGYNCLMNNCGADLGRNDGDGSKSWNNLYTKGGIKVKKSGTSGFWSLAYPQKDGTIATLADIPSIPTIPTKTSDLTNDGSDGTSTYVEADEFTTVTASKATAGTAVSCYKSGGVVSQTSYTSGVGFTVAEGTVTATSVYTGGGTVSQTSYSSESITPYTFADVTALAWAT